MGVIGLSAFPALKSLAANLSTEENSLPALFIGHGSPMNAIEDNEFTRGWRELGKKLPKPKAILCISAHWETRGTFITAMESPKTIHDFGGFPKELFDQKYEAPGSPTLAQEISDSVKKTIVQPDHENWGLDHGAWSILKPMFPHADIPVLQLSIDSTKDAKYHYELAGELAQLRKKGVLIVGSGNIVHNLGRLNWNAPEASYDWATEFNEAAKERILQGNHNDLINFSNLSKSARLAVPTPEHYLPLLYVLGTQARNENAELFNDKNIMGSISMTSVILK